MLMCQWTDGCDREAVIFKEVGVGDDTRIAGICAEHEAESTRKMEDLHLLLATVEIRCPKCNHLAPRGLLWHSCDNPEAVPPHPEVDS